MAENKTSGASVNSHRVIRLEYQNTECGRTMATSPDIEGFSFLLEANETPETMEPTLKEFLRLALNREIESVRWSATPESPFKNRVVVLAAF